MLLTCPHCSQRNRIPAERLAQDPACGKCHELLLNAPVDAELDTLAELLSQQQLPVLVDFWAPWCAPCRGFAPTFKAAAERFTGSAVFAKVNTEDQPQLGQQFNIRAIPTLLAFFNGQEIGRVSGALPAAELERLVRQTVERARSSQANA